MRLAVSAQGRNTTRRHNMLQKRINQVATTLATAAILGAYLYALVLCFG